MNPIPTTNAMKPAPGKGVSSFPTPVIKDTVIVEVVNAWKGDYTPLEYGTKWDDVPHASVQGSFPDHKLISQSPNSEDGQWVKRIWANDRVDQDSYNYAIKYIEGSKDHPTYVRTYIIPRNEYVPLEDGDPDPLFNGAILTEQEVNRTEGELDSQYVSVTRAYETLPGPVVSASSLVDTPVGLALANVTRQKVIVSNTTPSGSFNTLQDTVTAEDTFKGQQERVTVASYPNLTTYDLDPSINTVIITEREVVNHNTPYAAKPLMLELTDRPLDQWKTLRITTRLANVPETFVEYKTEQFTFPALLADITTKNLDVGFGNITTSLDTSEFRNGINKFVSVTPTLRPSLSLPTRIRITTEFFYGTTPPQEWVNTTTYQISTQNVSYSGSLFSFNFGDVITNQISVPKSGPIVANDFDPKYGGVNKLIEQITFPASIPNYTQYIAKVNSSDPEIIIASQITREKTNLWSRRVSRVRLI